MKANVKQIFNHIQMVNPSESNVSSIGSFVSADKQNMADNTIQEVLDNVPESSLAYKIASSTPTGRFSVKQIWVMSYELLKNNEYAEMVGKLNQDYADEKAHRKVLKKAKAEKRAKDIAEMQARGYYNINQFKN